MDVRSWLLSTIDVNRVLLNSGQSIRGGARLYTLPEELSPHKVILKHEIYFRDSKQVHEEWKVLLVGLSIITKAYPTLDQALREAVELLIHLAT